MLSYEQYNTYMKELRDRFFKDAEALEIVWDRIGDKSTMPVRPEADRRHVLSAKDVARHLAPAIANESTRWTVTDTLPGGITATMTAKTPGNGKPARTTRDTPTGKTQDLLLKAASDFGKPFTARDLADVIYNDRPTKSQLLYVYHVVKRMAQKRILKQVSRKEGKRGATYLLNTR